jgi:hypothetical protein
MYIKGLLLLRFNSQTDYNSNSKITSIENSPQSILDSLDGSHIYIPSLERMFTHWPLGVSSHRRRLECAVDTRIDLSVSENTLKDREVLVHNYEQAMPREERHVRIQDEGL